MEPVVATYSEFITQLEELCQEQTSGCVFFTSNEKRPGRIMLKSGDIVNIGYANYRSVNAITAMGKMTRVKYRFDATISHMAVDHSLPGTTVILRHLSASDETAPAPHIERKNQVLSVNENLLTAEKSRIIENCLLDLIGPMATMICEDYLFNTTDANEAISNIADELEVAERKQFLQTLKQQLSHRDE